MNKSRKIARRLPAEPEVPGYDQVLDDVVEILESARRAAARSVNALMTATYWSIGRHVVEFEQGGEDRSRYGAKLLERLSADLTAKFGRGFSYVNLTQMRRFYLAWPLFKILQTLSEEFTGGGSVGGKTEKRQTASVDSPNLQTLSEQSPITLADLTRRFPLPWSHYIQLLKVELFFHRKLRCLIVIDLKLAKFTHADAGQMHLYLNYAREHWTNEGENPPVGLILCTQKDLAVVHYALENLPNKVLAAEYRTTLPDEKTLAAELKAKRHLLESRGKSRKGGRS